MAGNRVFLVPTAPLGVNAPRMSILDELAWRGLINDCTDTEALTKRLGENPIVLYCGFDPTSNSLHVGNLVPLIALRRFQNCGHFPIALAGGATGAVGDPSGKSAERNLLTPETLAGNIASVKEQLRRLLDFETAQTRARLLDNADWTNDVTLLDFLRDIGKHFTVNNMVAKESVRARMEDRDAGISFTEFSYMLLQAFDFYHLKQAHDCDLQIGGSDQWGNITAGIELTRRKLNQTVFGLTLPLITNADGSKFGKTEAGAVWLDTARTSVYKFYQFWIRADDRDAVRYLKYLTFLPKEEIDDLEKEHEENPSARAAHTALAVAMTNLIHGKEATSEAQKASKILFGGELEGINESTFNEIVGEVPTVKIESAELEGEGMPILELFVASGLCQSNGQARKDLQGGGLNLNNERQSDPKLKITTECLLFDKHLLLRKGKRNYTVLSTK